jgi:hypothetical protein
LHKIGRKDKNFPIFFGRTTKIGPILAVRVNKWLMGEGKSGEEKGKSFSNFDMFIQELLTEGEGLPKLTLY